MHMEDPGFWDDPEKSQIKLKELKALKDSFDNYNELVKQKEDAEIFIEREDLNRENFRKHGTLRDLKCCMIYTGHTLMPGQI